MPDKEVPTSASPGCYLGFDFGLKRIGVATGNTLTTTTMPLDTVTNRHGTPDWATIDDLVREWRPVGIVVGYPLHMDGKTQAMTEHAAGFARQLSRRYVLPVFSADERLSSVEAEDILKSNRKSGLRGKTRKHDIDKLAASIVLQRWLETVGDLHE